MKQLKYMLTCYVLGTPIAILAGTHRITVGTFCEIYLPLCILLSIYPFKLWRAE